MERWSLAEAARWQASKPWICGCNFLPSSAVNFLEMWHRETFDFATIERELAWASDIGFNTIRVNLHDLVWQHDRSGLLDRLDRLMDCAYRQGIETVPCLFDDCGFGGNEPIYGRQPGPISGVHNSRAVACPGRGRLAEGAEWKAFEAYVRDIIQSFRDDRRIVYWDLYNEPGNRMLFGANRFDLDSQAPVSASIELLQCCFKWARDERPEQPLSVAAWTTPSPGTDMPPYQTPADRLALELSDIVSFHAYCNPAQLVRILDYLKSFERPAICSEWMARAVDSRINNQLELFQSRGVGCLQWGFVDGRTQTRLPWPRDLVHAQGGRIEDGVWFHDLLHRDGRAYDPNEIATIKSLTGKPFDEPAST